MKVALLLLAIALGGLAYLLHGDSNAPTVEQKQQLPQENGKSANQNTGEKLPGTRTIKVNSPKSAQPIQEKTPATTSQKTPQRKHKADVIPKDNEMIRWVKDDDELAELDAEMGLREPTELDQLRFEDELAEAKAQLPENTDGVSYIPLETVELEEPTSAEDYMISEPLEESATMDDF
ncbi:hypothetical protein OCL06_07540 [Alteromonas sp. ASW11-19]|uniref:Uncharacterized protein n=1 Tax=Alteromonas salexigens TaxID=2982530 RepID=A0ABT2VNJ7_9ALTE|nr:hypothetical protein [Alteromonas salexigens]MCU7554447.1 hypothetical protein [Alteromonas salexigens]